MSWTYSGNPASSDLDQVRFYVGDTNVNAQLVTDEEILFALAQAGSPLSASVIVAGAMYAAAARCVDETVGPLSRSNSQKAKSYYDLWKKLQEDLSTALITTVVLPFVGGRTVAGKQEMALDTNATQPLFSLDGL